MSAPSAARSVSASSNRSSTRCPWSPTTSGSITSSPSRATSSAWRLPRPTCRAHRADSGRRTRRIRSAEFVGGGVDDGAGPAGDHEAAGRSTRGRGRASGGSSPRPVSGSTVQPVPRRTISRSTSGWWLSATTSRGAPRARSSRSMIERVCEPSGNSTHGPHDAASAIVDARRAVHGELLRRSSGVSSNGGPATVRPAVRRRRRGRVRRRSASRSAAPDGATRSSSVTSGRSRRNSRSASGKWRTAAASIIPMRTRAGDARALAVGPRGEVAGESEHLAGVGDARARATVAEVPAPSVPIEQRDAEPPFEFGEALRECRRADADASAAAAHVGASSTATRYSNWRIERSGSGRTSCRIVQILLHRIADV